MPIELTEHYKNLFRKRLQSGMLLANGCATMKLIQDCLEGMLNGECNCWYPCMRFRLRHS